MTFLRLKRLQAGRRKTERRVLGKKKNGEGDRPHSNRGAQRIAGHEFDQHAKKTTETGPDRRGASLGQREREEKRHRA